MRALRKESRIDKREFSPRTSPESCASRSNGDVVPALVFMMSGDVGMRPVIVAFKSEQPG